MNNLEHLEVETKCEHEMMIFAEEKSKSGKYWIFPFTKPNSKDVLELCNVVLTSFYSGEKVEEEDFIVCINKKGLSFIFASKKFMDSKQLYEVYKKVVEVKGVRIPDIEELEESIWLFSDELVYKQVFYWRFGARNN